jgi:NAD(P)-dependent dehydrogenase (short-subunit alcohol dehydrogenase family)
MRRMENKNIVITGASKGLGRQLALDFAREGAAAIALVARHADQLYRVREEIRSLSPRAKVIALPADLRHTKAVERVAAAVLSEFQGRVDVLINNASALGPSPMPYLLDYPLEEFRRVLDTNLIAPFLLTRKLAPGMLEHGGSIINVTSDAGVTGYPGWGAYGISKFGLEGLSQTWASELEGTGIRVNRVDPGDMDTDMHRAAEPSGDPSQWADPASVTEIFLYLSSDAARGVSGRRFRAQEDWRPQDASQDAFRDASREQQAAREFGTAPAENDLAGKEG